LILEIGYESLETSPQYFAKHLLWQAAVCTAQHSFASQLSK
jgi:hypothetical protein